MAKKSFDDLQREVIGRGLCVSCGACAGVCPFQAIRFDYSHQEPAPVLASECKSCGFCARVCPGADVPLKDIDERFMGRARDFTADALGVYKRVYKGWAKDPVVRSTASSGGMVSSLLRYAFDSGMIDGALVLGWDEEKPYRAAPLLLRRSDEVMTACRWTAEAVPVLSSLNKAVYGEKLTRLAVVGMPCQIHAVRKLQMNGPKKLAGTIVFSLGLFCAATYYFEGIRHLIFEFSDTQSLDELKALDYRGGQAPGSLTVVDKNNKVSHVATKHDYTWHFLGPASFKRDRCLMCVDYAAEAADISCGDIFQPVVPGSKRVVCTISRTDIGEALLAKAAEAGYIEYSPHDPDMVPCSGMGWESKKHAAVYRLLERRRFGWPVPDYQYELSEEPKKRDLAFPK